MTTKFCAKQIPHAENPCVLEVNHSGGCAPALFWCQIHRRPNVDPEFCSACIADATTKVSVTVQVLEEALQKQLAKLAKLEERLENSQREDLLEKMQESIATLDRKTRNLHGRVEALNGWCDRTQKELYRMTSPLGEELCRLVASRLVRLAKRIDQDIPF